MLRITVLSLLLGALALIAGLILFFSRTTGTEPLAPPIQLNPGESRVIVGAGTPGNGELQLELSEVGVAMVKLTEKHIAAEAYPYLHLAISDASPNLQVGLSWTIGDIKDVRHTYSPHNKSWSRLWLATNEIPDWKENVGELSLVVIGQPRGTVRIADFGVYPASPLRQLQAIFSDLTGYVPWNRAAMNSHTGVTPVSLFYPTPLIVAFLALSLLAYGLLLLVFRSEKFRWQVVALIFLACWISLDMLWQNRLLQQVADTYRTFSSRTAQEKLAVGPDAYLYNFIARAIPLIQPKEARVFVSASDTYLGQRGAFYLYPFNVYWPGPGGEFPPDYLLHSGDHVVLINPTTLLFNAVTNVLVTSDSTGIEAELLLKDPAGKVVRVK